MSGQFFTCRLLRSGGGGCAKQDECYQSVTYGMMCNPDLRSVCDLHLDTVFAVKILTTPTNVLYRCSHFTDVDHPCKVDAQAWSHRSQMALRSTI